MDPAFDASSVPSDSEDGPAAHQSGSASEGVEKRDQVEVLDKIDVVAMPEEAAKDVEDDNRVKQMIESTEKRLSPLGKCHGDEENENGRSNTSSHSEIVSGPSCNIYKSVRLIGKSDSVDDETFVDQSNVIEGRALNTDDSPLNNELISSPLKTISRIDTVITKQSVENSNNPVQDCPPSFSSHSENIADSCQTKLPALQSRAVVVVGDDTKQEHLHEVLPCTPTTAVTSSQDDREDTPASSGPCEQNTQGIHVTSECKEKQVCDVAEIPSSSYDAVEGRSHHVVETVPNEAPNTTVVTCKTEVVVSGSVIESVVTSDAVTKSEENQGTSKVDVTPRTESSADSSGVEIEKTATLESKLHMSDSKVTTADGSVGGMDDEKEEGELEEGELDDDEEEEGKTSEATPVVPVKAAVKGTVEGNPSVFEQVNAVTVSANATKKASEVPKPSEKSNVIVSDEKSSEEGAKEDKKRKIEEDSDKNSKKKKKKHHHYDSEDDSDETGPKFRGRRGHADPSDFDAMLQQAMHRRTGPGGTATTPAPNSGDDYLDEMDPFSPPGLGRGPFRPGFEGGEGEEGGRSKRRQGGPGGRWSPPQPSSKTEALCVHFLEGTCTKGNECQYSHNVNHRVGQMHQKKMELCKFYLMGCCAKRQKCLYMHKDFPCKRYHTGIKCDPADKCKFSHEPLSGITRNILLKHLESAPKDILGKFPRLSKVAAHYVVLVTEAYRNRQPIDIEKMPGLRDWKSMGFKYVDRALRSYDKAHGKRSRKDPRPDGTAYSDSPDDDPTAINPSILLNPNHMPLNPNYMLMNPNHMPINPNHMSMNSSHMSMNSNHMSMNPNHIPLNPNHMSMNPNLMPVNPNKIPLLALPSQPPLKGGCDSDDDPNNPDILTRNRLLLELSKEDALDKSRNSGGGSEEEEAAEERRHRKKGRKRHRSDRGEGGFEVEDALGHKRRHESSHQRNRHRSSRKERRDSRHGEPGGPRPEEGDEKTEPLLVAPLLGGEGQTKQNLDDREEECGMKNERKEEVNLDAQQKATENKNQFPPGQHSDDEPALRQRNLEGSEHQPSQHQAKGRIAEYKERQGYQEDWYSSDDDMLDSSGVSDGKSPRLMMDLPPETKVTLPHGGISAFLDSVRRAQSATNTSTTSQAPSIGSPTPSATHSYERDGGQISSSDEGNFHGRPSSVNANEDFSHVPHPTSMTTNVSPSSSTSMLNRKPQSLSHTAALSPPASASSATAAVKPEPPKKYDPFEMFRQQQQNELLKYREQQEKERLQKQQLQQGDQQQPLQSPNQQHSRNPSLDSVSPPGSSSGHSGPDRRNESSPLPPVGGQGPYHHDDRTFEPASSSQGFYDRGPYSGNQSPPPTRVGYVSYSRDKDPEGALHAELSYGRRDKTGSPQLALRPDKKDSPTSSPVPLAITTPSASSKPAGLPGGFYNLNFNNINVPSDLAKVLSDLKNNTKLLSKGATPSANTGSPSTPPLHPNKDALADKSSGLNLATDTAARPLSSRDPATDAAARPLSSRDPATDAAGRPSLSRDPATDAAAKPSLSRDPRRLRAQRDSTESRDSADSSGRDLREGSLAGYSDSREMLRDPREFRDSRDHMDVRESRDPRQNRDVREDQRDPWGLSREPPFPTGQSSLPERRDPRTTRDPRLSREASIESGAGRSMDNPLLRDRRRSNSDSDSRNSDPTCDIDLEHLDVPIAGFATSSSLPFHVPVHEPATIVNGSITSHPPMVYKLLIVTIPDVSYANVTRGLTKDDVRVKEDPRLYRMFYGLEEPPRVGSPKSATVVYDDPESPPPASAQESVVPSPAIDRRDPRMNRDPRVAADSRTVNPNKLGVSVDIKSKDPRIQTQNQDPRSQNQDPRSQNQDPRSVIPDSRSIIPDPRCLNPDPRTVNPDVRSLNQDPRAPILDPRHSLSLIPPIDSPMPGSDPRNPYLKTIDHRNNDPRLEGRGADPRLSGGRADPRLGVGTSRDPRANRTMEEDPSSSLDPRHRPCILGHHPHEGGSVSQYGPPQGVSTLTAGGHMPTPHPMGMLSNAQNGLPPNMPNPGMASMHHGGHHNVYPGPMMTPHDMAGGAPRPMMAPHDMGGGAPRPMNPYMNYGNMGPGVPGGFIHSQMNNDPNIYTPNMMHEGPAHMYHGDMGGGGGHGGRGHPNNRYYHSRKNKNPYRGGGGNKNDPRLNKNLETQASFSPPPPVV